jgi:dienelactone hydrolase
MIMMKRYDDSSAFPFFVVVAAAFVVFYGMMRKTLATYNTRSKNKIKISFLILMGNNVSMVPYQDLNLRRPRRDDEHEKERFLRHVSQFIWPVLLCSPAPK